MKKINGVCRVVSLLLLLMSFGVDMAFAQNAHLSGLVKDPSSAVVAGAEIELLNVKTGTVAPTKSNASGYFSISSIQPGEYQLSGSAPGFQKTVANNITIHAADSIAIDLQLRVGKSNDTVTVSDQSPLLQTETGSISTVVTQTEINNIPLQGQNPLTLIGLTAGITMTSPPGLQTADRGATSTISYFTSNGSMNNQNEFTIDGIPDNITDRAGYMPFSSDIQEFNVLSSAYDAQYGHGAGASVVVVTKAGTNDWHGSAYEFFQNDALQATKYFSKQAGLAKPPFLFNQFGAAIGGPIWKKHMFFFFNYDGIRTDTSSPTIGTVPTAAQRAGDFSNTFDQKGNLIQIFNPFTSRPDPLRPGHYVRDAFSGNKIPSGMINSASAGLFALLPMPNQPGVGSTGANNYAKTVTSSAPMNNYSGRYDYQINERNRLFGKFARESTPAVAGTFLLPAQSEYVRQVNTGIGWTSVLNSSTTLEARLGWMGYIANAVTPTQSLSGLGFTDGFLSQLAIQIAPTVNVSGISSFGNPNTNLDHDDDWGMSAGIRHVQGRHDMKAGFDGQIRHENNGTYQNGMTFNFDQQMTQGPDPATVASNIGSGIAAYLLGAMSPTTQSTIASLHSSATIAPYYAIYGQDAFRISERLTLNVGLRWEVWLPATERYDRQTIGFAYDTPNPIQSAAQAAYAQHPIAALSAGSFRVPGGLLFATPSDRRWGNTFLNNFGPRVGFAYRINDKTVLRGGFGTFYNMFWTIFDQQSGFSSTTPVTASIDGITPYDLFNNPIPGGLIQPPGASQGLTTLLGTSVTTNDRNERPSSSSRWSFGLERQITPTLAIEANYVGQSGSRIPTGSSGNGYSAPSVNENTRALNFLPPQYLSLGSELFKTVPNPFYGLILAGPESLKTISEAQLLQTYPEFTGVGDQRQPGGSSTYHSLQVTATKRMSRGLSMLSTYTFSKLIDRYRYINPSDPGPSRMIGEYDAPQRVTVGGSYELPFGRGRAFGWKHGAAGELVSGWSFGLNGLFQSGFPVTVGAGVVQTGTNPRLSPGQRNPQDWFNKAAFAVLPSFTLRTAPWTLTSLRADAVNNWNVSLMKETTFAERFHARLQIDAFNLANRTQFGVPNVNPAASQYGTITSQANSPRTLQLGLKMSY